MVGSTSITCTNCSRSAPLSLIRAGPRHRHVLVDAAQTRGVLLEPVERRVEGPRPAGRHVVVRLLGSPDVVELQLHFGGQRLDAVEERHFVGRTHRPTLGAGAVVTVDVDDQCVVELAEVLVLLDDAADLVVAVRRVRGEDLDLADEQLLLVGGELIPGFDDVSEGQGASLLSCGTTPSFFCSRRCARAASRNRRRRGAWR